MLRRVALCYGPGVRGDGVTWGEVAASWQFAGRDYIIVIMATIWPLWFIARLWRRKR